MLAIQIMALILGLIAAIYAAKNLRKKNTTYKAYTCPDRQGRFL